MTWCMLCCVVFFFKQKTAYEMRISDWSSDVCSSDLKIRRAPDFVMHRKYRLHQSARIATYGMGMAMRAADARQRQQSGNTEHDGHTAHQTIAIVGMSQVLMPVQQPPQLFRISYQQVNARRHRANTLRNHSKRSEEHTSELQSLMRISYAAFFLKKQKLL